MIIESGIMQTQIIYSDDRLNRYLLRKTWDDTKPYATVLMTNAGTADTVSIDYTTLFTIRNLKDLGFGRVDLVNLTSKITKKIAIPKDNDFAEDPDNVAQILQSAEEADKVIIAWGRLGDSNKKVQSLQDKILEHLKQYENKLYQICDDNGEFGFHPLAPSIRFTWHLIPFEIPKPQPPTETAKPKKKNKKKQSQTADLPVPEIETAENA